MAIRIITDSAADFTLAELEQYRIEEIGLPVSIDGKDQDLHDRSAFWAALLAGGVARTAQLSPAVCEELFRENAERGDEIVLITISSGMSGTNASAVAAHKQYGGKVYIVDSLAASVAQKRIVSEACRLRDQGFSGAEIFAQVEAFKSRVKLFAMMDTLEFLARGGRISSSLARIGNLLQVKPIITFTDGKVNVIGRCVGVFAAVRKLCEIVKKEKLSSEYPVRPIYADSQENMLRLVARLQREKVPLTESDGIGATIGAHIGPRACGLVLVVEDGGGRAF